MEGCLRCGAVSWSPRGAPREELGRGKARWTDLVDGSLAAKINIHETGSTLSEQPHFAWTGTSPAGNVLPSTCVGWTNGTLNGRERPLEAEACVNQVPLAEEELSAPGEELASVGERRGLIEGEDLVSVEGKQRATELHASPRIVEVVGRGRA